jgi:myo-inositol-1-phosphate synthase
MNKTSRIAKSRQIKLAIVGVGNCASSLVQGIALTRSDPTAAAGTGFADMAGYLPSDIETVCAIDVDRRKIGQPLHKAIFAAPNCTSRFYEIGEEEGADCVVKAGPVLDGVAPHMALVPDGFEPHEHLDPSIDEIANILRASGAEIMILFLPVGSTEAAAFYAECALEAGLALVNAFPVFIASDPEWSQKFFEAGLPVIGDDIKAQFGATIIHRDLVALAESRGVTIDHTYQLNVGGNTDFRNMLSSDRLASKRVSKTEAVLSAMKTPLPPEDIRVGPSDYVQWLGDQKVAHIRIEGRLFGGAKTTLEVRLQVEDSPNAAAEALIAIRAARIARDRGVAGAVDAASAWLFKHPPVQFPDTHARELLDRFVRGNRD